MLRDLLPAIVSVILWGLAALLIKAMTNVFYTHGMFWGFVAFGALLVVMDGVYRLMGYKRGLRDVP